MKKQSLKIVLILSLLFNIAFIGAFGYRWHVKRNRANFYNRSRSERRRFFKERLDLTDEQRKHFHDLRIRLSDKIHPIRKELKDERQSLARLLMSETYDSSAIEKQLDTISTLQNDLESQVVFQLMEEKSILTPEQKKHFIEAITKQFHTVGPPSRLFMRKGGHERFRRQDKNQKQNGKEDSSCVSE